jgi:hypothetical protein
MRYHRAISAICIASLCSVAAHAADQSVDKASIEKRVASYTAAFNAGDAKALAAH